MEFASFSVFLDQRGNGDGGVAGGSVGRGEKGAPVVADIIVILVLLLPAFILLGLMVQSVIPWASRSLREAEERADVLVRDVLSGDEYDRLRRLGYLDIPSPSFPHRIYRIPSGPGTVSVLEEGRCVARLCVTTAEPVPAREAVVIHKLMIEGSEQDYLRAANHLPC